MNVISTLAIVATCFSLLLVGLVLRLNPRSPMNRWVAVWFLVYGFEAFCEIFVVSAKDPSTFWLFYKASRILLAILDPLTVITPLLFAGIRRRAAMMMLVPITCASVINAVEMITNMVYITGFRPGPWGNVGIPNPDPFWRTVSVCTGLGACLINLAILVWAWKHHPSRGYRSFILLYLALCAVSMFCAWFGYFVFWHSWGRPDVTFSFGLVYVLGMFALMSRYSFLSGDGPAADATLLRNFESPILLLDDGQQVLEVSEGMARLLQKREQDLEGKPLSQIIGQWPGFAEAWEGVKQEQSPRRDLEGNLGADRFRMSLIPSLDRFGQVRAVYVLFHPEEDLEAMSQSYGISAREREVGNLVLRGMSTQAIADALFISQATVKSHLHSLYQKTSTTNRVELLRVLTDRGAIRRLSGAKNAPD